MLPNDRGRSLPRLEGEAMLRALDREGVSTSGCVGHAVFGVLAKRTPSVRVQAQHKHTAHTLASGIVEVWFPPMFCHLGIARIAIRVSNRHVERHRFLFASCASCA